MNINRPHLRSWGMALLFAASCGSPPSSLTVARAPTVAASAPGASSTPSVELCDGAPCMHPKQLALGLQHSCAILTDDRVACWGADQDHGRAIADRPMLVDGLDHAVSVATGDFHTCVALASGAVSRLLKKSALEGIDTRIAV